MIIIIYVADFFGNHCLMTGCLLPVGLFFVREDPVAGPEFFLSMGFKKWGTQAIPCEIIRWGEDAAWVLSKDTVFNFHLPGSSGNINMIC